MTGYEEIYRRFWAPILDAPGVDREDLIKRELYDYRFLLGEVPEVYAHMTDGRVSKPNTLAFEVIGQHDHLFVSKADVAGHLRAALADAEAEGGGARLAELVAGYARDLDPDGGAS